jgi:hypothetical protein
MIRSLTRAPGLLTVTAATIALGIGALTTVLGVADAALWRDPSFPGSR